MASIGSYYITIMPDMSKFNGQIVSGLNGAGTTAGKQFHSSFLDSVKGTALGMAVGNLISSGLGRVMDGLSTGIQRLDIVNNFPRVMENLGVGAAEAAAAVDEVQRSLIGLPTSLQDGVQAVQRLTTSMGDVGRATDVFIAFNNALVAGAAPASLQASALEQFSQAVAKGKPDMLEWRSLMNAMPAQLEQVAASMGMTSSELGEGLRQGDIAMSDFLDAIVRLNTEGVGEYASFSEQVGAATHTVGTALTNMGNRIGQGWAAILGVIGQEGIFELIERVSNGILGFMTSVASAFQWLKYTILGSGIGESLASIGEQLGTWFGYFTEGLPSLKDVASTVISLVDGALKWIAENGTTISFVVGAIAGAVMTIFAFNIAEKIVGLTTVISTLFTTLMANPFMLIVGAIAAVVTGIVTWLTTTEEGRAEWQKLKDAITRGVSIIKDKFDLFRRNLKRTWDNIKTTAENVWNGIKDFFKNIWNKIKSIFTDGSEGATAPAASKFINFRTKVEGIWNALKTAASTIWNGIKSVVGAVVDGIVGMASRFESMRTSISSTWDSIKTTIGTVVDSIKTTVSNSFNTLKSIVADIWNGIKTAITNPIEAAKGVVDVAIGGIQGIINTLTGKRVDVGVNDNRRQVNNVVSDIKRAINAVQGKRVNIEYYGYQSGIRGIDVTTYTTAAGNKRIVAERIPLRMAAGGIVTKATAAIFGEAGNEAVIPLSNRDKVRPFAKAVAAEIPAGGSAGAVTVTGNNFYVRTDEDIDRIAERISLYQSRKMAGRL